ncbi:MULTISPECIES: hypothetical protein [unclassified Streptomyces]|uniref:hypothetical protein n=1 Tax=unclassified Streptomyces TaxID=2593676 RepID=UPI00035F2FCA|nr:MULTISPECIES: hypothetical protein [unclassified Streptomyces]MYX36704.1 hypothetical protein [Streptomyces sp. SID8377]
MCDEFCGPALAAWLAGGPGGPRRRLDDWARAGNGVALLPAGHRWDAVRVPERPGHQVLARLRDGSAPVGPAMWDRRCGFLYFLVPPRAGDVWSPLGLRFLTRGGWLAAADPRRPARHPALWLCSGGDAELTGPAYLYLACMEVLTAGARPLPRVSAPL